MDERKGGFDFVLVQKHASEDILPGEQLFMSYGAMPPSVLLLQYGFFEGHLSCVDVAFGDKLFCLGRDVRLAKIGKVLRWLSASHVHPEAVLSALLKGLAKQEGRLHAYQNNSCVGIRYESDDAEVARYHLEQKTILRHLRQVVEAAIMFGTKADAASKRLPSLMPDMIAYALVDKQTLLVRIVELTNNRTIVEQLFGWPNGYADEQIYTARRLSVPRSSLLQQSPYLWLAVKSLKRT